jgi:hypothetical protein
MHLSFDNCPLFCYSAPECIELCLGGLIKGMNNTGFPVEEENKNTKKWSLKKKIG